VKDRQTDRRTDGRTELRWLRCTESRAAFARKNEKCTMPTILAVLTVSTFETYEHYMNAL